MKGLTWRMGIAFGLFAACGAAVADEAPAPDQPATAAPADKTPAVVPPAAAKPAEATAPEAAKPAEPAKPISGIKPADLAKLPAQTATPADAKVAPAKTAPGGLKGTVAVGDAKPGDYPDLAKIQLQYAIRAAMTKVQGKVLSVELEAAGGFLIWEVTIVKTDKTIFVAKVDAGSGAVLAVDHAEPEQDEK